MSASSAEQQESFGDNMKFWTLVVAVFLLFAGLNAEAARLGGGRSFGKQSSNVTQRQATPAQGVAKPAAAPAPTAPPAVAPKKPWGAMLGGLAAGLGLAWLSSSLGLGGMMSGMGQILMFALLALAIMAAYSWFKRSRQKAQS